ncbi:MAG: T9SS type A sorting domain-containing protein [Bacteroidota bacterium]
MKRIITLCFLTLLISISIKAQNLVPNGDFELGPDSSSMGWQFGAWDTTNGGCTTTKFVNGPYFWTIVTGSPDRLVEGNFPPCNWDKDTAASGNAYVVFWGIFTLSSTPEAGKSTLLIPLQKDSIYHLSYYVKLETFSHISFTPVRIAFVFNNIGDSLVSSFVTDTIWQYRDTIFKSSVNSSEIKITGIDYAFSAVDIDNIKLEKITPNLIDEYLMQKNLKIYPNPFTDILFIDLMNNETPIIKIFDFAGKIIDNYTIIRNDNYSLDCSKLSSGIYFINIITNQINITK